MPQPLVWKQLRQAGVMPESRSGHTFSRVGNTYVMFGGLTAEKKTELAPTNDVFTLRLGAQECTWTKEKVRGQLPLPRTQHTASEISGDRVVVFGGYYSTTQRFNTTWILHVPSMEWSQPENQPNEDIPNNKESPIGAPEPRASHTATVLDDMVYVFGGHGGVGYQRKSFNDMYVLNTANWEWTKLEMSGMIPEPRAGHSMCVINRNILIYGGWSSKTQFNNCSMFNTETLEWTDPELFHGEPRRNHAAIFVEAIPSNKYFIFGGSCAEFEEGQHRHLGEYSSEMLCIDINTMTFSSVHLEDQQGLTAPVLPKARELCSIVYDKNESRLIVFGGWNYNLLPDLYSLNVSNIVGPPYAVNECVPALGPLTGNTTVNLKGVGFYETSQIDVRFSVGKQTVTVAGTYKEAENIIELMTPNFENIGPKEAEIRLSFRGGDWTTTSTSFTYYMNTRANKSLAFGPGLLPDQLAGDETIFYIQARNEHGLNRESGRDKWSVRITQGNGEGETQTEIECNPEDTDEGFYICKYAAEPGEAIVEVFFEDEKLDKHHVRGSPFTVGFVEEGVAAKTNTKTGPLMTQFLARSIEGLETFTSESSAGIKITNKDFASDVHGLISIKTHMEQVEQNTEEIILKLDVLEESLNMYEKAGNPRDSEGKRLKKCNDAWGSLQKQAREVKKEIAPFVTSEAEKSKLMIKNFEEELKEYGINLKGQEFQKYENGVQNSLKELAAEGSTFDDHESRLKDLEFLSGAFGFPDLIFNCTKSLEANKTDLTNIRELWNHIEKCTTQYDQYLASAWPDVEASEWEEQNKALMKQLKDIKVDRKSNCFQGINNLIKNWSIFLPLVSQLKEESMRDRHWDLLKEAVGQKFDLGAELKLQFIYDLNLPRYNEQVEEIADQARQEAKMEKTLEKLGETWDVIPFDMAQHKNTDINILRMSEEDFEMLEENQVAVQNMFASRYLSTFEEQVLYWQKALAAIFDVISVLQEVQRLWSFLENLFMHSQEVKKELPEESEKFVGIDKEVKEILKQGETTKIMKTFSIQEDILPRCESVEKQLNLCEKALNEFLDGKRRAFPRFYFVSTLDLLDILSNGNNPSRIMRHMSKVFQAVETLTLNETSAGERPNAATMITCVGQEQFDFHPAPFQLKGKVEIYLQDLIDQMRASIRHFTGESLKRQPTMERAEWLVQDISQVTLVINLMAWVNSTEAAFVELGRGNSAALKNYAVTQNEELNNLIEMVQGKLERPVRTKIMCLITMDTHSRDILIRLQDENVTQQDEFQWQSQLKAYWHTDPGHVTLNVCDAQLDYGYEYLGNGPRLVITPLTDRIYVTATQALHLKMGCAPSGPAGTGKTETTKDLAAADGTPCYVFNCSPEMTYLGMGNIFKGLASSGAWGCFDEFNRLLSEVLSVCSVQFKAVTDAIKQGVERFEIQGDEISLNPACGAFITMNPGYLGRQELPESLKALFRPITVVVPDLELICENMLMSEGFVEAKILARKFTTLYALCRDLLSKQDHYDWGLRAIKSVLVVAGMFKRADPQLPEQALLMRALRDFNQPRIVAEDWPIFMGLITDLFPNLEAERKRDMDFEAIIEAKTVEEKLWPDPEFIKKVVQLQELMAIRHCVFIIGPAASGKTSAWKTLAKSNDQAGHKTTAVDINPKSVSSQELYGYVMVSTKEWKDGLLSKTMRSLGEIPDTNPKWLVLDGDLDSIWIESMNSVMDDNKILTLASNERIPLKAHMRMIFEIRDLKFASPATVSRAGILFISDFDGYQWRCYVNSWVQQRPWTEDIKARIHELFDKYVSETFLYLKKSVKWLVPTVEINLIMSLCTLLESLLGQEVKAIDYWFVFCMIWAFAGGLAEKDGTDYRRNFSNWWKDTWKIIKFPAKGTIFDYYVDPNTSKLEDWEKILEAIEYDSGKEAMGNVTVPTPATTSNMYFMNAFIAINKPVLLIGNAGCGKTQLAKGVLNKLDPESFCHTIINMNYYTDAVSIQTMLEQPPLEKKAGKNFGPPGKLKLIYMIDDINMPMLDEYNTQSAIALIRQHADYGHWYDRVKLSIKDINNCQYLAAMNPTAGSFFVNPRLQRHFWLLSIPFPDANCLFTIYNTFAMGHFSKFKGNVQEIISPLIKASISLHEQVHHAFKKTAINFHYEFNIRHISNIFQGILTAQPKEFAEPEKIVKLWIHESERIYGDRLVSMANLAQYQEETGGLVKRSFAKFNLSKYFQEKGAETLIFCHFAGGLVEKCYDQVPTIESLYTTLREALNEYNEINTEMDLELFEDAMKHVCRISRIIANPSGHALLVGVGGSGKQSLSRLAAYICNYQTMSITISASYGINELKTDLQNMYNKAGVKDDGILFLFTEGQITNERFLVYINDLLSSGEIADLFEIDEKDAIVNNVRSAVRGAGIVDSRDNCWNYFINQVRTNLHMALCFSPVGDNFRNRARKFPAIVNCTVIDWFQDWPQDALLSVSGKFLSGIECEEDVRQGIIEFMPYSFGVVNQQSEKFKDVERRYCYTTPKSFLELIKLFTAMYDRKREELESNKGRLESGLIKLITTQESVAKLKQDLTEFQVVVEEKKASADEIAETVGIEKAKVEIENDKANEEAEKCAVIQKDVEEQKASCEADLAAAIPLVEKAQAALDTLSKKDFVEAKSFNTPPKGCDDITCAVMHIVSGIDPTVAVDKKGNLIDKTWKAAQKMMANPQQFLESLTKFKQYIDDCQVPLNNFKAVRPLLALEHFNKETIYGKSKAVAGLCEWVINIVLYYDVISEVEPKRQALRLATEQLQEANEKLEAVKELVARLQGELQVLVDQFDAAIAEKEAVENEANRCQKKLDLANRLVNALGSEKDRWGESIENFQAQLDVLIGDVLVSASFVSYVGPFTKPYRDEIINKKFLPFIMDKKIPMSDNPSPITLLSNDALIAKWNNQKLPSDQVSVENGCILTNSERFTLIIDPQLQGIAWLKEKEKDNNLQLTRMSNSRMIRIMETAIDLGQSVILENIEETIDAVLAPVIGRNTIKRGKSRYMKLGEKEIPLSPDFKLYLQTKLSNPHYPPEVQAETTLINFTVTQSGLEDQLLSLVVKKERPDLAEQKEALIKQANEFKIKLKELEDEVLYKLTSAEGDILENVDLVENLETAKAISEEVKEKVIIAKETTIAIDQASEQYRPAAHRGALIFFLMNELFKIHTFYMFALEAYLEVIIRAIKSVAQKYRALNAPEFPDAEEEGEGEGEAPAEGEEGEAGEKAEGEEAEAKEEQEEAAEEKEEVVEMSPRTLKKRVNDLIDSITYFSFTFVRRGMLEVHKLIFSTMLTFRIMIDQQRLNPDEVNLLVAAKPIAEPGNIPENLNFLTEANWGLAKLMESVEGFGGLIQNMEVDYLQWKRWFGEEKAETIDMPRQFKEIDLFKRMLLLRALRPDRLTSALAMFVAEQMGERYVEQMPFDMQETFDETNNRLPVFFVLFPGYDPTVDVEKIGSTMDISIANGKMINISMGQGQEDIAVAAIEKQSELGGWVMLHNLHLMQTWLKTLELTMEKVAPNSHEGFRLFFSSEPPALPYLKIIPESILQTCIKVANEAPQSFKANMRRAYNFFSQEYIDKSDKPEKFKPMLFALCIFHALVLGRRRFGNQGWSKHYSFNDGDLQICADVLHNYLAKYAEVPYSDLRYLYGEIMYGGHITDGWDRRTNNTYLKELMKEQIMTRDFSILPGLKMPDPVKFGYEQYSTYIEERLPIEAPVLFGLHANAEINYFTNASEGLFNTILEVQGGAVASAGSKPVKKEDIVANLITDFLARLHEDYNMIEIKLKCKEDPTPEIIVCFQECERMNILLNEIRRSLVELQMGLEGALNITDQMEALTQALSLARTPPKWAGVAYFSKKSLEPWFVDMTERCTQLDEWQEYLELPKCLWLSGLFNPMSFITAIMQTTARAKNLPLDFMSTQTNVTMITNPEEITEYPEEGRYIHGLFLEGAGWELGRTGNDGYLTESTLKDIHPRLPVVNVLAVPIENKITEAMYNCPVYVTSMRGPTYVFAAGLKMESEETKEERWILAGVALLMADD